ncbi:MAG TPA: TrbI/VirB10 family protein [Sphingomicrobium sp.]|nr:TrbI/VirB10 family protein [Sphingomicrobium sp.]
MPVTEIGDPRLQALFGAKDPRDPGVQPVVRLPRRGLPPLAIAAAALIAAILLFVVLNERRERQAEPAVRPGPSAGANSWAPPPLYIPPAAAPVTEPAPAEEQRPPAPAAQPGPAPAIMPAPEIYATRPAPEITPMPQAPAQPRVSAGAPLVIDSGSAAAGGSAAASAAPSLPSLNGAQPASRMRASALANRSTTVPQGTLIPAVLETGFDSTRPGFARAIVSRDVRSFDGTNILIPRGSRLVGEYRADVAQGQKRAIISWTRLIRPDGMTIAMDSPAVDTVGRGGVPAHVNTHFFSRLGDSLLQSTVGLGGALAQRQVTGPVVVLPGATAPSAGQIVPTGTYTPTLSVPAGKSISVFVAQDLDFSAAAPPR